MKDYVVLDDLIPKTQELHRAIFDKGYEQGKTDVLDKIRTEITDKSYLSYDDNPRHVIDESWVLEIIDKYREVSE